MNANNNNPLMVIANGLVIVAAILAFCAGLYWFVFPGFGIMVSIIATGTAAGVTIAPALGTAAGYATVGLGAAVTIRTVVLLTREAKKEPLVWGAPILGVLSVFLVQMSEEFWSGPKIAWIAFSGIVGLLVIVGGVFYSQESRMAKVAGAVTSVLAPAATLAAAWYSRPQSFADFVLTGDFRLWFPLILLGVVTLLLGVLAHVADSKPR